MLYTLLWKPEACFETLFNKFTAKITGGAFCHSELVFQFKKAKWLELLKSFNSGRVGQRAKSLSGRLNEIFPGASDKDISLCFYTIWGSEMNLRLLTATDTYVFNKLPDKRYTKSVPSLFSDEEQRAALGFCLSELHKKYDNVKAVLFWVPRVDCLRRQVLPSKYFCSEFIVYLYQHVGYAKTYKPENITPNDLPKILEETENIIRQKRFNLE